MDGPVSTPHRFLVPGAIALIVAGMLVLVAAWLQPDVTVTGVADGGSYAPAALRDVQITALTDPGEVEVLLDGAPAPVRRDGARFVLDASALPEGEHSLVVNSPDAAMPLPGSGTGIDFTVDATAPAIVVDPVAPTALEASTEVRGRVEGAEELLVNGAPYELEDDGTFVLTEAAGAADIDLLARDEAGNTTAQMVPIPVQHPGMRAVHMTAQAWSAPSLREPVLQLAKEGAIDTIQLDIKDESGEVGYASQVPLANEIGASKGYYDARAVVDQLHAAGLRVVGRIVAFRDPLLGQAAWEDGHRDWLVQNANGTPYTSGYGSYSFTNFANPEVRAYNVALAEEAAGLGFDEILYDYVRRPDGAITGMHFEGLTTTPEQSIADFLAETRPVVRKHGALLGASVFGIAATRPTQIAQDITLIAKYADYVAPMVYPSHWGRGEYNVADPESSPFDITARSLADFQKLTEGTGSTVIPWLQAFSLRVHYGATEVRAQIDAGESIGIRSFILWDPNCRYAQADALRPASQ
ncbi:putative glycoside hydrolase [Pseudonocardia zijingensis]|uniref:Glycoside hydrolase n=1 Tax=Pseudonocardia zijingensis TaxID=153376 RepID=A0ABN1N8D0_9PSEU